MKRFIECGGIALFLGFAGVSFPVAAEQKASAQAQKKGPSPAGFDSVILRNAERMMKEGQHIFRFDTFGSEAFWGDAVQLHKAIAGEKNGGVGGGVSPQKCAFAGVRMVMEAHPPHD